MGVSEKAQQSLEKLLQERENHVLALVSQFTDEYIATYLGPPRGSICHLSFAIRVLLTP
jgi:hypothetical protein